MLQHFKHARVVGTAQTRLTTKLNIDFHKARIAATHREGFFNVLDYQCLRNKRHSVRVVLLLEPPSTPQVSMLPRALAGRAYRKCRLFCKRSRSPPAHSNIDAGGRRGEPQSDCVGRVPFISQTPEPGFIAIPTVLDAAMLYNVNPTPRDMAIATTAATTPNGNYISLLEPCGRVRAACGAGTDEDSAEQPPETEVSFRTGM